MRSSTGPKVNRFTAAKYRLPGYHYETAWKFDQDAASIHDWCTVRLSGSGGHQLYTARFWTWHRAYEWYVTFREGVDFNKFGIGLYIAVVHVEII